MERTGFSHVLYDDKKFIKNSLYNELDFLKSNNSQWTCQNQGTAISLVCATLQRIVDGLKVLTNWFMQVIVLVYSLFNLQNSAKRADLHASWRFNLPNRFLNCSQDSLRWTKRVSWRCLCFAGGRSRQIISHHKIQVHEAKSLEARNGKILNYAEILSNLKPYFSLIHHNHIRWFLMHAKLNFNFVLLSVRKREQTYGFFHDDDDDEVKLQIYVVSCHQNFSLYMRTDVYSLPFNMRNFFLLVRWSS